MEDKYINKKIVTVVIVSYNNSEVLINCLNSIYQYNDIGDSLEVIVVDNSENLDIYNLIKNIYKNVIVIKNNNMGFGQANNIGAKLAQGKYLIFLNPDTLLIEPIFLFAIKKFEEYNNLALFGVKLLSVDLKSNMSFGFIDKFSLFYGQLNKILNKYNIFLNNMMYISGANIFIKKSEFIKAGMFDENIFM
ncbi:MAG TPA: glycosyltransferase family 2 protein, partial [Clostridiales bacterium]|nr:glycosyltransferase family 2 protein [Clostridiales bacterium]